VLLDEQYGLHGAADGGIHEMVQSTKVATEGIISDGSKCNESYISHASKEKYQKETNKAKLERTREYFFFFENWTREYWDACLVACQELLMMCPVLPSPTTQRQSGPYGACGKIPK
jgi:hypothetical protein